MSSTLIIADDERALVKRAQDRPSDFAALYDHYFPKVYNYVRYRVQDAALTDDLTAQVFTKVLTNINQYQAERGPFSAWLFGVARNVVTDHFRGQKKRRWFSFELLQHRVSDSNDPEDLAIRNEEHERLLAAVAQLPERERDLIGLRFGAGLTNRRIAELTGLTESNVGVIIHRTLRRLRVQLQQVID